MLLSPPEIAAARSDTLDTLTADRIAKRAQLFGA